MNGPDLFLQTILLLVTPSRLCLDIRWNFAFVDWALSIP